MAQSVVAQKPTDTLRLFDDRSATDPASAGSVVLIANWTSQGDHTTAMLGQLNSNSTTYSVTKVSKRRYQSLQ